MEIADSRMPLIESTCGGRGVGVSKMCWPRAVPAVGGFHFFGVKSSHQSRDFQFIVKVLDQYVVKFRHTQTGLQGCRFILLPLVALLRNRDTT